MAVALNYFNRVTSPVTTTPTPVYTVPFQKAGIIITALASNLTSQPQTITASLSTAGTPGSSYVIVQSFQLPPNDTTNIVINKLVLNQYDSFIVSAGANSVANITLSVLETVNTP
jgi:hypothetical protein